MQGHDNAEKDPHTPPEAKESLGPWMLAPCKHRRRRGNTTPQRNSQEAPNDDLLLGLRFNLLNMENDEGEMIEESVYPYNETTKWIHQAARGGAVWHSRNGFTKDLLIKDSFGNLLHGQEGTQNQNGNGINETVYWVMGNGHPFFLALNGMALLVTLRPDKSPHVRFYPLET
nr:hypothetical protein Iba_chr10cCG8930 [Ipomoea batatas]